MGTILGLRHLWILSSLYLILEGSNIVAACSLNFVLRTLHTDAVRSEVDSVRLSPSDE